MIIVEVLFFRISIILSPFFAFFRGSEVVGPPGTASSSDDCLKGSEADSTEGGVVSRGAEVDSMAGGVVS